MGDLDSRFLDTSNIYSGYNEIIGSSAEVSAKKATVYYDSGFKVLGGGAFGGFTAGDRVLIFSSITLTATDSSTFDVADIFVEGLNTSVTITVNTGFTLTFGPAADITVQNITMAPVDADGVIFSSVNGSFKNIKAATGKIDITSITAYVEQDIDGLQIPGPLNIVNGVSFRAYKSSFGLTDSYQTITTWSEQLDSGGNFNPTTGYFTAPHAGNYLFSITGKHNNTNAGRSLQVHWGVIHPDIYYVQSSGTFSCTHILALAKDADIYPRAKTTSGSPSLTQITISACLLSY